MKLPITITDEEACKHLGYFGKCRKRKLKKLMKSGVIKKFARDVGYVFDLQEILEVRDLRFSGKI